MVRKIKPGSLEELVYSKFGTQIACAKALGWPRQKLSYIVTGQRVPSLSDTKALAEVLGVSVDSLIQKILL